jgi:hypothetical protein
MDELMKLKGQEVKQRVVTLTSRCCGTLARVTCGFLFENLLALGEKKPSSTRLAPCSLGLSATSQQYFSLRTKKPPATSQQYFFLRTNQHQPSGTS